MRREEGFTLIEILTVIVIAGVLMTLSAFALREYWWGRSLEGSREEVISELRNLQERAVSESHPLVFGAWFKADSSEWGVVQFDPKDVALSGDDECTVTGATKEFPTGVKVASASFEDLTPQTSVCAAAVPSGAEIALFFARGTAAEGEIVLEQPKTNATETLVVSPLTGRVEAQ